MGRKPVDWTNKRVGKLVPLHLTERYSGGNRYWLCQCDCGNVIEVSASNLRSQHVTSCGCNRESNIKNQKFNSLIAIEPTDKRANHDGSIIWKCKCDCGNICYKSVSDLKSSTYNSCGCNKRNSIGERKIAKILKENNISFEREKSFNSCKFKNCVPFRFDFYVNNEYLIEYDGIQHFKEIKFFNITLEDSKLKDTYKNQWCKENNIPLIRIPYTHLNKICLEDLLLETSKFII